MLYFTENEVDASNFGDLSEMDVKEMFPAVGAKIKIMKQQQWCNNYCLSSEAWSQLKPQGALDSTVPNGSNGTESFMSLLEDATFV